MLPPINLSSTGLSNAKPPVQPVHFRTIPSNKTQAELEELSKNIENKNINSTSQVKSNSAVSETKKTEASVSNAKPERLRFDTYEPSEPVESAGIYEPTTDVNGNKTVTFDKSGQVTQKAEYKTSGESSKYDALKTDYYNSVAEENKSILSNTNKEEKRVNMLNNELAQAAQKMHLTSAAESVFS